MTGNGEIEIDSKETGREERRTSWHARELDFNDENRNFENEIRSGGTVIGCRV